MVWQFAARLSDAREARPWLSVTVGADRVVVAAVQDRWFGVEDRCSHAGCAFSEDAELDGSTIICDCHGSEFDIRSGAVLRGPAERPLRTVPVRVVVERLEVDL